MYSPRIQKILKAAKISIGDRISVQDGRKTHEGLLMPSPETSDPESIILKLDNGYNVGVSFGKSTKIAKSRAHEPRAVKEEARFELGKTSREILKLKFDPKKPLVTLIATGGTISSRVDYKTGGVKTIENPQDFLHNVPELVDMANIRLTSPFAKMSEDMNYTDWVELAKAVARELNTGAKGVIVTHGTDWLHYTSAVLSFFLRNLTKPVVVVGAQRSSDRGSSDAGMNLLCAVHTALSDMAEVGICMHASIMDDYCLFMRGTKVRKMDTQRRDAFRPVNDLPLARVYPSGKIEKLKKDVRIRSEGKVESDTKFEPRIAIIKPYPGSDPSVIDYHVSKGVKGFVVEGSGLGHVPTNGKGEWISTIKKHVKDGIPFVVTPQTIYGRINPNVYTNLRVLYHEAKAIPGEDMLTETAFVKLGWVLGHTKDPEKVREMMLTNYAGEISERTLPETFLY